MIAMSPEDGRAMHAANVGPSPLAVNRDPAPAAAIFERGRGLPWGPPRHCPPGRDRTSQDATLGFGPGWTRTPGKNSASGRVSGRM